RWHAANCVVRQANRRYAVGPLLVAHQAQRRRQRRLGIDRLELQRQYTMKCDARIVSSIWMVLLYLLHATEVICGCASTGANSSVARGAREPAERCPAQTRWQTAPQRYPPPQG